MKEAFALTADEVLRAFDVDVDTGLSSTEASRRLERFGSNQINQRKATSGWKLLLRQFISPLVALLLFASILSFLFREWLDGIAILTVIFINAAIGFLMEFKAGRAMEALKKLSTTTVRVLRDGKLIIIDADMLVPGDVVFFEAGDIVSADARIHRFTQLQTNESSLTGESLPVNKINVPLSQGTLLADQTNMLFKGTFVTKGNVWAIVVATGMATELGKVARLVQQTERTATPLEEKLEQFSRQLIKVTITLVLIIFFWGWLSGRELIPMLQTSIALAVAAIPEGLPIVATIALASGMMKMAANNVVVRRLSAVETLGGTNVICTDKTGTLTENRMTVVEFPNDNAVRRRIIEACILCNTADIDTNGNEIGDPLETALLRHVRTISDITTIRKQFPKINEEPFSSETKRMATAHQHGDHIFIFAKGAFEEIIRSCNQKFDDGMISLLTEFEKEQLAGEVDRMAARGYKVLAFAFAAHSSIPDDLFSALTFLGFVSLIDPPRANIATAITQCHAAGIKVIMVTGDHAATAREIATQVGIQRTTDVDVMNGSSMKSLDELNPLEKQAWMDTRVFARVSPLQKLDLVKILQDAKCVVGMTGDGINDAPALRQADIGIAMGQRGTQVAQDVADMVIKDDSFASIVSAIREGRIIFENIRKFVIFLLSCNLSELLIIATCSVLNLHFQLLPLQILFINIITDVLPALALGLTDGDRMIMKKLPREINEPIIDSNRWKAIAFYSIVITISCIVAVSLTHASLGNSLTTNHDKCNSVLFITLIVTQLLHSFNMNSDGRFLRSNVFRNKYLWLAVLACFTILAVLFTIPVIRDVLSVSVLSFNDWMIIAGSSILSTLIIQLIKARSKTIL